ncbi:hypothetical protein NE237_002833 [Protea cynaroides]|uniref:Uncharacterized protein n=1 Tax=Protea cynaroides TaxID=273540 RepID=A0A9Q0QS63_9MAGN|nr:hypothetical protein NE237_002833 [Protea cynaroides]
MVVIRIGGENLSDRGTGLHANQGRVVDDGLAPVMGNRSYASVVGRSVPDVAHLPKPDCLGPKEHLDVGLDDEDELDIADASDTSEDKEGEILPNVNGIDAVVYVNLGESNLFSSPRREVEVSNLRAALGMDNSLMVSTPVNIGTQQGSGEASDLPTNLDRGRITISNQGHVVEVTFTEIEEI